MDAAVKTARTVDSSTPTSKLSANSATPAAEAQHERAAHPNPTVIVMVMSFACLVVALQ